MPPKPPAEPPLSLPPEPPWALIATAVTPAGTVKVPAPGVDCTQVTVWPL